MIYLKSSPSSSLGKSIRSNTIVVPGIYTPGNTSQHEIYITHNLNTRHVIPRVRKTSDINALNYLVFWDFFDMYGIGFRGFQYSIHNENTIMVRFCHDGNTGSYTNIVDVFALE